MGLAQLQSMVRFWSPSPLQTENETLLTSDNVGGDESEVEE
jgi:hypothetical protein